MDTTNCPELGGEDVFRQESIKVSETILEKGRIKRENILNEQLSIAEF